MNCKQGVRRAIVAFFVLVLTLTACVSPALAKVGQTYESRVGGLRVHKGPSGDSEVVGRLTRGEKVIHRGTNKGWWRIENSSGDSGYVYRTYLKPVGQTWKKNAFYKVFKTSKATVRQGPRPEAAKLGTVKRGTTVQLVGKQGNWGQIKLANGNKGWVQLSFLTYSKG